ncbi:MAG: hypothetical protein CTY35_04045 [Methylotenera sp.]|nr:MAG: hypothetical protein CTY35_04045 [Methylotenera sp.]
MSFLIADRVRESSTTTGTGSLTLAGAVSGFKSFGASIGNGNSTYYCIAHKTLNEWEVGIGTYTASGTLLSRDSVISSSNSNALVSFSAGDKDVFVTAPANKMALLDVAQTFTATQVPDNGTASISTTSTYTFDGTDQIREITLTNAITVTFGAPSGIVPKAMYKFMLKAGDTSARVFAWNAAFKFPNATPPLTAGATTNGAHDIINFIGGAGNTLIYDGHNANVG